jgi:hypothetical protein
MVAECVVDGKACFRGDCASCPRAVELQGANYVCLGCVLKQGLSSLAAYQTGNCTLCGAKSSTLVVLL